MTADCVLWTVHTWIPGSVLTIHAVLQDTACEFSYCTLSLWPFPTPTKEKVLWEWLQCLLGIILRTIFRKKDHNCNSPYIIMLIITVPLYIWCLLILSYSKYALALVIVINQVIQIRWFLLMRFIGALAGPTQKHPISWFCTRACMCACYVILQT